MKSALRLLILVSLSCGIACSAEDDEASCESTTAAGSCTGTFTCGNSGIQFACDRATQACVLKPGQVTCVTVSSSGSCPTEAAARQAAGCSSGAEVTCRGGSDRGIVVECAY